MCNSLTMRMHFLMHDEVVRIEMAIGPALQPREDSI
jgi:hypothetical protein